MTEGKCRLTVRTGQNVKKKTIPMITPMMNDDGDDDEEDDDYDCGNHSR